MATALRSDDNAIIMESLERHLKHRKDGLNKEDIFYSDIKPLGDNKFEIAGDKLTLTKRAHRKLLSDIQIPLSFYNRCDTDLQVHLAEKFLAERRCDKVAPVIYNGEELWGWGETKKASYSSIRSIQ